MNIDAKVVEIKPDDNIEQKYFLSFNINYMKKQYYLANYLLFNDYCRIFYFLQRKRSYNFSR
jgi:hypothetical protein